MDSLFICLAAICNAVMDTLAHHYSTSIFNNSNKQFWDASVSWKNKYIDGDKKKGRVRWTRFNFIKPVQISDGWHIFKTLCIFFIVCAVAFHDYKESYIYSICKNGFFFVLVFVLFYDGFLISTDDKKTDNI